MSDTPRRIEDLLSDWMGKCGTMKQGASGRPYWIIPGRQLWSSFQVLLEQLLEEGYDEQYIKSPSLNTKIAKTLLRDGIPIPNLNEQRFKMMTAWYIQPGQEGGRPTIVGSHFKGKMGTPKELKVDTAKEPVKKKEIKFLDGFDELDVVEKVQPVIMQKPKDMIEIDTSDIADPEPDLDFMKRIEEARRRAKEGSVK